MNLFQYFLSLGTLMLVEYGVLFAYSLPPVDIPLMKSLMVTPRLDNPATTPVLVNTELISTPEALSTYISFAKYVTSTLIYIGDKVSKNVLLNVLTQFVKIGEVFGVLNKREIPSDLYRAISLIIDVRSKLRALKMFDLADLIRTELSKLGVMVSDTKRRSFWCLLRRLKFE